MASSLFREKSINSISSPDQLDDYVKVTNPSVWILLTGIILILVGVGAWGVFGTLDTKISVVGEISGGRLTVYVPEKEGKHLSVGDKVILNDSNLQIETVSDRPVIFEARDPYLCHISNLGETDWVYIVKCDATGLDDGIYEASIVTDTVSPMSFVTN